MLWDLHLSQIRPFFPLNLLTSLLTDALIGEGGRWGGRGGDGHAATHPTAAQIFLKVYPDPFIEGVWSN